VETGVCGKTGGTSRVEHLGRDELHKGRRSGGGPLNKGVIQPTVSRHLVEVATCAVMGS
jgi:hypothetical protein